jgi:hypothetical protein
VADSVSKSGYFFQLTATAFPGSPASCNGLAFGAAGQGFKAAGDPQAAGLGRFFGTNATNVIVEDTATLFATMPEFGVAPSGHPLR